MTAYLIISIRNIEEEPQVITINTTSFNSLEEVTSFLWGKDISLLAVFKNYQHIQLPLKPLSTEDIKRILTQS